MSKITINAGIGEITFDKPMNLKLTMLVEALKDHIEIYGLHGLTNFLSSEEGMEGLKEKIQGLQNEVDGKDSEIQDLESELWSVEDTFSTIDCGIGTINYEADNLALIDIMENLDNAIQKTNFRKVNEHLQAIV